MNRTSVRSLTLGEASVSMLLRHLPVKHGKHRLLDFVYPRMKVGRGSWMRIPFAGSMLELDASDLTGWHFAILRDFDPEVSEVLLAAAEGLTSHTFWDVGANKCACSFAIATALPEASIVCIEPQSRLEATNRENLHKVCGNRFQYFQVGLSESAGGKSLSIPESNSGAARVLRADESSSHRLETVEVLTALELRDRTGMGWPTLVKIDVEGHEEEVIASLRPALESKEVRAIVFEHHRSPDTRFDAIEGVARDAGYPLFAIRKSAFSTWLEPMETHRGGSTDFVLLTPECADTSPGIRTLLGKHRKLTKW